LSGVVEWQPVSRTDAADPARADAQAVRATLADVGAPVGDRSQRTSEVEPHRPNNMFGLCDVVSLYA